MGVDFGFVFGFVPSASQWNDYFRQKADDLPAVRVVPTDGGTVTVAPGTGTVILDPAVELSSLTVVAPTAPKDQQVLRLSTSQPIDAITVNAPVGYTLLGGGPFVFSANGGMAWQFLLATMTWYKIQ